ncbi:YbgC/FadM family acyl-CoA thioesterase [SAR86 cluster bacterium]|jgi:acyl-CoA thioester hydrolase|nr:YbgC/FadM family acyl-CoA thioesterase [SAR86 cluster bacterium]
MSKIIKCNDLNIKIYVEDTDFQGVVYHSNYLKFFERSRSEFLEKNNISQKKLITSGNAFVVKSIEVQYLASAKLGDEVIVESNVEKISNARLLFHQKVFEAEKNSDLVNGKVEVCFVDLSTKKPQKFSDDLLLIFK